MVHTHLSWSEHLFLSINTQIGRHPWLDRFMQFGAHDALYILAFIAILWATGVLFPQSPSDLEEYLKLLITAGTFGFILSWIIAFLAPHTRPIIQFPFIKELITPLGIWKTFPSDHTIAAFTIVGITWIMGEVSPLFIFFLGILASWIAISRVYVGVHYPSDIIGGILVAILFSLTAPWLLILVTEPLYHLLFSFSFL